MDYTCENKEAVAVRLNAPDHGAVQRGGGRGSGVPHGAVGGGGANGRAGGGGLEQSSTPGQEGRRTSESGSSILFKREAAETHANHITVPCPIVLGACMVEMGAERLHHK